MSNESYADQLREDLHYAQRDRDGYRARLKDAEAKIEAGRAHRQTLRDLYSQVTTMRTDAERELKLAKEEIEQLKAEVKELRSENEVLLEDEDSESRKWKNQAQKVDAERAEHWHKLAMLSLDHVELKRKLERTETELTELKAQGGQFYRDAAMDLPEAVRRYEEAEDKLKQAATMLGCWDELNDCPAPDDVLRTLSIVLEEWKAQTDKAEEAFDLRDKAEERKHEIWDQLNDEHFAKLDAEKRVREQGDTITALRTDLAATEARADRLAEMLDTTITERDAMTLRATTAEDRADELQDERDENGELTGEKIRVPLRTVVDQLRYSITKWNGWWADENRRADEAEAEVDRLKTAYGELYTSWSRATTELSQIHGLIDRTSLKDTVQLASQLKDERDELRARAEDLKKAFDQELWVSGALRRRRNEARNRAERAEAQNERDTKEIARLIRVIDNQATRLARAEKDQFQWRMSPEGQKATREASVEEVAEALGHKVSRPAPVMDRNQIQWTLEAKWTDPETKPGVGWMLNTLDGLKLLNPGFDRFALTRSLKRDYQMELDYDLQCDDGAYRDLPAVPKISWVLDRLEEWGVLREAVWVEGGGCAWCDKPNCPDNGGDIDGMTEAEEGDWLYQHRDDPEHQGGAEVEVEVANPLMVKFTVTLRLTTDQHAELNRRATIHKTNLSGIVDLILFDYLLEAED